MTPQQLATLRAAIDGDPALAAQPRNADGHVAIANALNQPRTPTFFVWRKEVPVTEIMGNGFDWTRVDNMTVGEARIWEFMTQLGSINPSQANVRAGVNEAFKGTAQDDAMRLAIFGHCQRAATRFEHLYATGSGTTSSNVGVGPGDLVLEGPLQYQDVETARNL